MVIVYYALDYIIYRKIKISVLGVYAFGNEA